MSKRRSVLATSRLAHHPARSISSAMPRASGARACSRFDASKAANRLCAFANVVPTHSVNYIPFGLVNMLVHRMRSFWFYLVLPSFIPMLTGCHASQSAGTVEADHEHDPDDIPITEADVKMPRSYPEAVEQIVNYCDAIERAVSAGTPSKAHRPLDE